MIILALIFNLIFIDINNGETLTGVEVKTDKSIYYSNLNGEVTIPENEVVKEISYVSYQTIDTSITNVSGTIYMK